LRRSSVHGGAIMAFTECGAEASPKALLSEVEVPSLATQAYHEHSRSPRMKAVIALTERSRLEPDLKLS
jgi:hypothetical protein